MEEEFENNWWARCRNGTNVAHVSSLGIARAIDRSRLSAIEKKLLLKFIFARDEQFSGDDSDSINADYYRWTTLPHEAVREIYDNIARHGVVSSPSELASKFKTSPHYKPIANVRAALGEVADNAYLLTDYFSFVDRIAPTVLDRGIAEELSWQELKESVQLLLTPLAGKVNRAESNTPNIQAVRTTLADRASVLADEVDLRERIQFFLMLTATGNSLGSDRYFEQKVLPGLILHKDKYLTWIKGVLIRERIQSNDLRLRLSRLVLEPRVENLGQAVRPPSSEDLYSLITDLNLMAPQGSLAKDKLLEKFAWQLHLDGIKLSAFIEDQKTSNWKRENATIVNLGSSLSAAIFKMSFARRKSFLSYLIDPVNSQNGLPQEVVDELIEQALNQIIRDKNVAANVCGERRSCQRHAKRRAH